MARYWLGLGSNIGDRAANLADALVHLARRGGHLVRLSSVYETAPVGFTDQPDFLNMVICVDVALDPPEMLRACLAIESAMGRVRRQRWGPRIIDIDLLLWDGPPVETADLELPHPRMAERQFVLVPLAEIAPDLRLPDGRRAADAADLSASGICRLGPLAAAVRREMSARSSY